MRSRMKPSCPLPDIFPTVQLVFFSPAYQPPNILCGIMLSKYVTIAPSVISAAQHTTILFSQDLDSSTVRPDFEKFINSRQTAAHTTAAPVAIPAMSLLTVWIAFFATSKLVDADTGITDTASKVTVRNAVNANRGISAVY